MTPSTESRPPEDESSGAPRPAGVEAPRFPLRLALFGVAAVAAFAYGFLAHTAAEAGKIVQDYGYYTMAATTLWWLTGLYRRAPDAMTCLRKLPRSEGRAVIVVIAALTTVAVAVFPYSYKILNDELVLQATAWNLHFFREVGTVVRGYDIEGIFTSLNVYLDKRPFFFPFVVSLVHDLTGYRELNGFVVNSLLLPVTLGLFYVVARKLARHTAALAGLVCFGASALLAQNANGIGMELLNLAMILLSMLLAADYLADPDEARLSALILTSVLLAQTRYESSLYVLPAALVVLEGWRRAGRLILPPAALVAPLLLIPCALHNTYLSGTPALWELKENMDSRFGAEYLADNLYHARLYFFDFSGRILSSWWLSVVGGCALVWSGWTIVSGWRGWRMAPAFALAVVLFAVATVSNLGLLMFYYWGQLDDPIVVRLVLPFNVILGLAIAWAAGRWESHCPGWRIAAVSAGGAVLTYVAFGLTAAGHHTTINQLAEEMAWEGRVVNAFPVKNRFVITNKSSLAWLMRRIPVIGIDRARVMGDSIRENMDNGTFQEVLVTQLLRPSEAEGSFVVDPQDMLPASYVLEPVIERHIGGRIVRISRVVQIKPEPKSGPLQAAGASAS